LCWTNFNTSKVRLEGVRNNPHQPRLDIFQYLEGAIRGSANPASPGTLVYFNTSKVRLEGVSIAVAALLILDFNTSKVRLEASPSSKAPAARSYFNTSKVRLEESTSEGSSSRGSKFQYLEGAIRGGHRFWSCCISWRNFNTSKVRLEG